MSGGFTTLSASGLLLDRRFGYVLTSTTLLSPFMHGDSLRKGVSIEMMTNGLSGVADESTPNLKWIPLKLVRIMKDPSLHTLLQRFRGDSDWTAGWPRGTDSSSGHLGEMDLSRRDQMSTAFWAGFEDIALLQIDSEQNFNLMRSKLNSLRRDPQNHMDVNVTPPSSVTKGSQLLLVGSPYGILSPSVFHNCIYNTMVSNIISLDSNSRIHSLSLADPPSDSSNSTNSEYGSFTPLPGPQTSSTPPISVASTIQQGKSRARRLKSAVLDKFPGASSPSTLLPGTPQALQSSKSSPCVILIDQPGLPGCEGGPVFDANGSVVGLLAPPLRRNDGSNVEVHLILPLQPFLAQVRELTLKQLATWERKSPSRAEFKLEPVVAQLASASSSSPVAAVSEIVQDLTGVAQKVLPSVVVISTGSFWGSGVVVSPEGYILTSAHIFRPLLALNSKPFEPKLQSGCQVDVRIDSASTLVPSAPPSRAAPSETHSMSANGHFQVAYGPTRPSRAHWHRATLVYVSSSHWDVALVKLDRVPPQLTVMAIGETVNQEEGANAGAIMTREVQEGEPILVVGFALFGPSKRVLATCTSGVISRVAHLNGQPKLLQSSASVNKGASGGALVDSNGQFIGLVTCNAMTKEGIIIPKINFSIPSQILAPIHHFIRTKVVDHLTVIERADPPCAALWSMSATPDDSSDSLPSSQPPATPSNQGSSSKGTKLIEFWSSQTNLPPLPVAKL
jgi:S1-C subfamily serine protease